MKKGKCTSKNLSNLKLVLVVLFASMVSVSVLASDKTYITTSSNMEFVLVKGGVFKMGNIFDEDGFEDELPVHQVTLNSYYISTYEVVQSEWVAVMGTNPSSFKGDNKPVENVSWFDAIEFCNKLSQKEGLKPCYTIGRNNHTTCDWTANGYRLPTESEWEFAARGGNDTKGYMFAGSNSLKEVGYYKENSMSMSQISGTKLPNELGIYDMSGNVWEWCWDWYSNSYNADPVSNPHGVENGIERCRRGGSWSQVPKSTRSSNRLGTPPELRFNYVGLRLVKNAQ
jgi:sulfatase modifying factor 1